jgi:hypothetical protein
MVPFGALLVAATSSGGAVPRPDANGVVRLAPQSVAKLLPSDFVRHLNQRGCLIPQASGELAISKGLVGNMITGSFARPGQRDSAVLCSINGITHIEMHWGGKARCPSVIEHTWDDDTLNEREGLPARGYSRTIAALTPKEMRQYDPLDGPDPHRKHHGIMDDENGLLYCDGGQWIEMKSTD